MARDDGQNKRILYTGSACALVTPFRDGEVDRESLGRLIDRQIEGGTAALVICGTTGEAPSLSDEEYKDILEYTVIRTGKRIPVIAGAGGASTRHAAKLGVIAAECGADALLCVTPYYVKASAEGLARHYRQIAEAGLPMILYNVPSRTGMALSISDYQSLAEIPNIVGVKEASGNVSAAMEAVYKFGDRFAFYSGCDEINLPLISVGYEGFISVTANIVPEKLSSLWRLWSEGRFSEALALDRELYPLTRKLFGEVNPIPVKRMLAEMGLCDGELRLPLY